MGNELRDVGCLWAATASGLAVGMRVWGLAEVGEWDCVEVEMVRRASTDNRGRRGAARAKESESCQETRWPGEGLTLSVGMGSGKVPAGEKFGSVGDKHVKS